MEVLERIINGPAKIGNSSIQKETPKQKKDKKSSHNKFQEESKAPSEDSPEDLQKQRIKELSKPISLEEHSASLQRQIYHLRSENDSLKLSLHSLQSSPPSTNPYPPPPSLYQTPLPILHRPKYPPHNHRILSSYSSLLSSLSTSIEEDNIPIESYSPDYPLRSSLPSSSSLCNTCRLAYELKRGGVVEELKRIVK